MSNIRNGLGKETKKERRRAMFRQQTRIAPEGRVPVSSTVNPTRENQVKVVSTVNPTRENMVSIHNIPKRTRDRDLGID